MIRETVVVTCDGSGDFHIAPMGAQILTLAGGGRHVLLQPFRPSTTLDNLLATGCATLNNVDDVRIIAGCVTGRSRWPLRPTERIDGQWLAGALSHLELEVDRIEADNPRSRCWLSVVREANHAPFPGFNRAKAAVIEAAILVSRLDLLPADKIDREIDYLAIAVDKTAGDEEREAWGWLMQAIRVHRERGAGKHAPRDP